jgi:hypothetical protein
VYKRLVPFNVIVTPQSIQDEVELLITRGAIGSRVAAAAFRFRLQTAAAYRGRGNCRMATFWYEAFIDSLRIHTPKGIDPQAAATLKSGADYLIQHCP